VDKGCVTELICLLHLQTSWDIAQQLLKAKMDIFRANKVTKPRKREPKDAPQLSIQRVGIGIGEY
jgi:hypothetical protein